MAEARQNCWECVKGFEAKIACESLLKCKITRVYPFHANELDPEMRVLHLIVGRWLKGKTGGMDTVTKNEILLMYCLFRKWMINLPFFLIYQMEKCATDKGKALAFGNYISRILEVQGVDLQGVQCVSNTFKVLGSHEHLVSLKCEKNEETGVWELVRPRKVTKKQVRHALTSQYDLKGVRQRFEQENSQLNPNSERGQVGSNRDIDFDMQHDDDCNHCEHYNDMINNFERLDTDYQFLSQNYDSFYKEFGDFRSSVQTRWGVEDERYEAMSYYLSHLSVSQGIPPYSPRQQGGEGTSNENNPPPPPPDDRMEDQYPPPPPPGHDDRMDEQDPASML